MPADRKPTSTPHPNLMKLVKDGSVSRYQILDELVHVTVDRNGWLHGPNITHFILPENDTQTPIAPRNVILHTNAGPHRTPWAKLMAYIARKDITGEPHFQLAGALATITNPGDLKLVQSMSVQVRADCNAKANSWWRANKRVGAISFETEDLGAASLQFTPWSIPQLHTLVAAITAICATYGIACATPTRWDDTGIGYHSQFPEWSIYKGKTCPGAARIRQMDYIRNTVAYYLAIYAERTGWRCGEGQL